MARLQPGSGNLRLEGIRTPTADTDAANKSYVDSHPGVNFDLHDDVTTRATNVSATDRMLISDESVDGDPNRYVEPGQIWDGVYKGLADGAYEPLLPIAETIVSSIPADAIATGAKTQGTGTIRTSSNINSTTSMWGFYDQTDFGAFPEPTETFTTGQPSAWNGFFTGNYRFLAINFGGSALNFDHVIGPISQGYLGTNPIYLLGYRDASNYAIWRVGSGTSAEGSFLYVGSHITTPEIQMGTPGATLNWYMSIARDGDYEALVEFHTTDVVLRGDKTFGQVEPGAIANNAVTAATIANDSVAGPKLIYSGTRSSINQFLTIDADGNMALGRGGLDIERQTEITSVDNDDELAVYDVSASANRKITVENTSHYYKDRFDADYQAKLPIAEAVVSSLPSDALTTGSIARTTSGSTLTGFQGNTVAWGIYDDAINGDTGSSYPAIGSTFTAGTISNWTDFFDGLFDYIALNFNTTISDALHDSIGRGHVNGNDIQLVAQSATGSAAWIIGSGSVTEGNAVYIGSNIRGPYAVTGTPGTGNIRWTLGISAGNAHQELLSYHSTDRVLLGNLTFGQVETNALVDNAVTTAKIADDAVTSAKLALQQDPANGRLLMGVGSAGDMSFVKNLEGIYNGIWQRINRDGNSTDGTLANGDIAFLDNYVAIGNGSGHYMSQGDNWSGVTHISISTTESGSGGDARISTSRLKAGSKIRVTQPGTANSVTVQLVSRVTQVEWNTFWVVTVLQSNGTIPSQATDLEVYVSSSREHIVTRDDIVDNQVTGPKLNVTSTTTGVAAVLSLNEDNGTLQSGPYRTFDSDDAGIVPAPNLSLSPNWDLINGTNILSSSPVSYNDTGVDNGRGWSMRLAGEIVDPFDGDIANLIFGVATWQNFFVQTSSSNVPEEIRVDDRNLSSTQLAALTANNQTTRDVTFLAVCDHQNWAAIRYRRSTGIFRQDSGNTRLEIISERNNNNTQAEIVHYQGRPRGNIEFFFPFNRTGSALTNLFVPADADEAYLNSAGEFRTLNSFQLEDPNQVFTLWKAGTTAAAGIDYNSSNLPSRIRKVIHYGSLEYDATAQITYNVNGLPTTVRIYNGSYATADTLPTGAAYILATKTITYNSDNLPTGLTVT